MDKRSSILYARDLILSIIGSSSLVTSDVLLMENGNISFTEHDMFFYSVDTQEIFPYTVYTNRYMQESAFKDDEMYIRNAEMQIYNPILNHFLMDMYYTCRGNNSPLLAQIDNIQDIDIYSEVLAMKSGDGVRVVNIPDINDPSISYPFTFYNGLVKVNKGDKLNIKVFDFDDNLWLFNLDLYKKKLNNTIHIYYKTLKVR